MKTRLALVVLVLCLALLSCITAARALTQLGKSDGRLPTMQDIVPRPTAVRGQILLKHGGKLVTSSEVEGLTSEDVEQSAGHGTNKHPLEAKWTWECLDENGPYRGWVWRMKAKDGSWQFARICDMGPHDMSDDPDDRWFGFNVVKWDGEQWIEVTTYIPKLTDKTLQGILNWLKQWGWKAFS